MILLYYGSIFAQGDIIYYYTSVLDFEKLFANVQSTYLVRLVQSKICMKTKKYKIANIPGNYLHFVLNHTQNNKYIIIILYKK